MTSTHGGGALDDMALLDLIDRALSPGAGAGGMSPRQFEERVAAILARSVQRDLATLQASREALDSSRAFLDTPPLGLNPRAPRGQRPVDLTRSQWVVLF